MNEFKSFYLKDLLALIDRVAMDLMMCPCSASTSDKDGLSPETVARLNHDIVWNNEGIRDMAYSLKQALLEGDGDND